MHGSHHRPTTRNAGTRRARIPTAGRDHLWAWALPPSQCLCSAPSCDRGRSSKRPCHAPRLRSRNEQYPPPHALAVVQVVCVSAGVVWECGGGLCRGGAIVTSGARARARCMHRLAAGSVATTFELSNIYVCSVSFATHPCCCCCSKLLRLADNCLASAKRRRTLAWLPALWELARDARESRDGSRFGDPIGRIPA